MTGTVSDVLDSPCSVQNPFERHGQDRSFARLERAIAVETPVAIEIDGIAYAVMMTTPADLEDFVTGFLLSEGLLMRASDLASIDFCAVERGIICRVRRAGADPAAILDRVRHRTTDSACGLCGLESLDAAVRLLPRVRPATDVAPAAIFRARAGLSACQTLNAETGAAHAAALADAEGRILLVREDVGRHNAFDKLIGAMARRRMAFGGGFALLTSRCSYDLVEKAARADCPLLATLSAPTSLALSAAAEAGIVLAVLVRDDALMIHWRGSTSRSESANSDPSSNTMHTITI
jgi:FdhD protein